jgi:inhibitor of KinA sporulation pathway (predicted exonuclease)
MNKAKTILVVDVEATCWKDEWSISPYKKRRNEIIEVGITEIDTKTKTLGDSHSIMVIPPTEEISEFCTELTTITQDLINKEGISFRDMIDKLMHEFKSANKIFASWGDYDRRCFERNIEWNSTPYPFSNMHLNVKALFAAKFGHTGGQEKCGLDLGIQMEGVAHRGVDDSRNIAKILIKLL